MSSMIVSHESLLNSGFRNDRMIFENKTFRRHGHRRVVTGLISLILKWLMRLILGYEGILSYLLDIRIGCVLHVA